MNDDRPTPGLIGRIRSRQAGRPSGLLGRIMGRAMVKDTAEANDRSIELLELAAPATVLDVGFGQGRAVSELVAAGHTVIGVDVSETMVSQARARNRSAVADGRADLRLGDGVVVPFDDDRADAAFTAHTIYFMADPAATLADVARVLRPGGRFVLACRVGDAPMPAWMDPDVYRIPTIAAIEEMLTTAGFATVARLDPDDGGYVHHFVADLPG